MSDEQNSLEQEIGKQIKILRTIKEWTQGQLAEAAGLRQNTISLIENGRAQTVENLAAIAAAYDISLAELVGQAERRHRGAA